MFYMDKGCLATDAYFMAGYFIDRSVLIMRLMYDHPFLMRQSHDGVMETKGKGKERKGKERKGKYRKGRERKGKERKGKERTGQDRTGQDRTGKERKGEYCLWVLSFLRFVFSPACRNHFHISNLDPVHCRCCIHSNTHTEHCFHSLLIAHYLQYASFHLS